MPERSQATPTRHELMALQEERLLIHEGYQFLDEKRIIVAQETLRQLADYTETRAEFQAAHAEAVALLAAAGAGLGLEGLSVYPPQQSQPGEPACARRHFLGLELLEFEGLQREDRRHRDLPAFPSPDAEQCAECFARLAGLAAQLALLSANLYRLVEEYRKTERRACALENVLLPEIDANIHFMEEQLEAVDQEEALRVRFAHPH